MKNILIIGANSNLAKILVRRFSKDFNFFLATTTNFDRSLELVKWICIKDANHNLIDALKKIDLIINFGWSQNNYENINLTNFILQHKNKNTDLVFISSISASPKSISLYSKNKYKISSLISENSQVNVFLGLVNFSESKQIKHLLKIMKALPFLLRFSNNFFNVYVIEIDDFLNKFFLLMNKDKNQRNLVMYGKKLGINEFLDFLEKANDIKKKITIKIPVFLIKIILFLLRYFPLRISIIEKILTFTFKDDERINELELKQNGSGKI